MRRTFSVLVLLVLAALVGANVAASAATQNDSACRQPLTLPYDMGELMAYDACRFDRLDAQVAAMKPASTPTASPTPATTATARPTSTPTPTASASPTATSSPSASASPTVSTGFPSATTTGVPSGTTLTAYSGPSTITTAGTVIDGKKITSCLVIKANNVIIRNSLITSGGCYFNVLADNGNTGLQLLDVEIDGQGNPGGDSAINGGGFTCLRCNLHGTVDGIKAQSNVVVQDSWIHDLTIGNDSHNDGIQSLGTTSLKVLHNRIVLADGATSAVILSTGSASDMRNVQVSGNLLGGGAFTVYGGYEAGRDTLSKISNISVTNNRFTTSVFPRGGAYGPLTSVDSPVVVSGNSWADGAQVGQPVS
jgi:hypothetical protein